MTGTRASRLARGGAAHPPIGEEALPSTAGSPPRDTRIPTVISIVVRRWHLQFDSRWRGRPTPHTSSRSPGDSDTARLTRETRTRE